MDAIAAATSSIHFETYIIHDDRMGRQFAAALQERAAAGVHVRVLYDWWGARGATGSRFWRELTAAGVEVRSFNAPRLDSPFGWISRDHRKCLVVDGRVAFVSGLCVGDAWVGDGVRGVEPWRDTGVAIQGPAVADVDLAFAGMWSLTGPPLPPTEIAKRSDNSASNSNAGVQGVLRVVATEPSVAGLFKLDHIVVAAAERSLWLTDAYFVAVTSYVQALCEAAHDRVDVRLLVPGVSDMPGLRALSRAGYRPLLEAGVRVFEWNGPMLHAKTAVADGRWARVGSTNLNPASWLGNWELDVAVEDADFARAMEAMYEDDLQHSTEIVMGEQRRVRARSVAGAGKRLVRRGSRRAAAGAIGVGSTIGAAITNRRLLGPAEARVLATSGVMLFLCAATILWWPKVAAVPLAIAAVWIALSLIVKAWKLHRP